MKPAVFSALVAILALAFAACAATPAERASLPDQSALNELNRAIRDVSDYLTDSIPAGSMSAFINVQSGSEGLSNFIIDNLIANAVNDRSFPVVDRHELDRIREELGFQLSGEVDDETARSIGRFSGAYTIVTGRVTSFGGYFHLTIRALDVQTAQVQGQYIQTIGTQMAINALIGGGGGHVAQMTAVAAGSQMIQTSSQQTVQVPAQPVAQVPTQRNVVNVEGASLVEKLQWIQANAANNTEYRIHLNRNESIIPQTFSFPRARNVTVRIRGDGGERVISLPGSGTLFTVDAGVTLILDDGVTLQGRDRNNASLVVINGRGTLVMNDGVRIIGNSTNSRGGGVRVNEHGNFTMNGGEIFGNTSPWGGGVNIDTSGGFTMSGGVIHGNTVSSGNGFSGGGGVYVEGNFTMTGGEITNNVAALSRGIGGGGVLVAGRGTFNMSGGEIYGNSTTLSGGGVGVFLSGIGSTATFTMSGGEISGNTSRRGGGGVFAGALGGMANVAFFTKTSGSISGNSAGGNGQAVLAGRNFRNSTAGPVVRLNSRQAGAAGGWEN